MTRKMLINATEEEECRVAVLKNNVLQEFYIERPSMGTCLGNIYKGRVANIEPSIGAAFVNIGGPRNGFLHASDLNLETLNGSSALGKQSNRVTKNGPPRRRSDLHVQSLLKVGQEIMVQVSKDGIGDKGPTLTTYFSLPGRYLVFMPGVSKHGISRKIESEEERTRLKGLVGELIPFDDDLGVIVRTAGANQPKKELLKDFRYLTNIWSNICHKSTSLESPTPLYRENDLVIRALRDVFTTDISEILVDSDEVYGKARDFMEAVLPRHVDKVSLYRGSHPLFDHFQLEEELDSVLHPRIALQSGGWLFIEQTEALVAIDVNSGKFKGKELEETASAINLEASVEIARQLRLRDLGGLIVIDFIDMHSAEHQRAVEKKFREALREDRARIKLLKLSTFGVIEMTRQRVRPSLESFVFGKCPHCKGTGFVATSETMSLNIIRKIRRWVMQDASPSIHIVLNDRMAEYILNSKKRLIMDLEEQNQKRILIRGDAALAPDEIVREPSGAELNGQKWLFE